ncbi:Rieske 2Fe-2S domain-containing protein, partial [Myxococcota bacterium]|nr:Rieske 2Fe-2S domain-containing protein [Myxococcota bacterium]
CRPAARSPSSPDTASPNTASPDTASPDTASFDTGPPCDPVVPGTTAEGWVEIPLAAYPALSQVGGQAAVDVDEAFLHLLVARTAQDCWIATWRVCTHGACEVLWDAAAGEVLCPCHQSRFAADGTVLQGPATEPLTAYDVGRRGDALWVRRRA